MITHEDTLQGTWIKLSTQMFLQVYKCYTSKNTRRNSKMRGNIHVCCKLILWCLEVQNTYRYTVEEINSSSDGFFPPMGLHICTYQTGLCNLKYLSTFPFGHTILLWGINTSSLMNAMFLKIPLQIFVNKFSTII